MPLGKSSSLLLAEPAFVSRQVMAARRFYLNLQPSRETEFAVVCGGWEDCAEDYHIDRSTFPFLSIEFVVNGKGRLQLGNNRQDLRPGVVFCYGPNVSQRITTSAEHRLQKYFVDFCGQRARQLLEANDLLPGTVRTLGSTAEVRQAFDSLILLARRSDRHTARLAGLQLEILIRLIDRAGHPNSSSERRARSTFERVCRHLDVHFLELRSLAEAASACHVDVSYLCRLFRRFHSEKPFQYLQRLQMQWAAERLEASGKLIREVSDELSMDPFQFSRTFKRIHGVSPTLFLSRRTRSM